MRVKIGTSYAPLWYDILDCSVYLIRNGGAPELIAANVITTDDNSVPLVGTTPWTAAGDAGDVCQFKYVDNSDSEELLGSEFTLTLTIGLGILLTLHDDEDGLFL